MSADHAAAMLAAAEGLAGIIDIAAGHRERAIAAGFSPTAAEQMALDVHHGICFHVLTQQTPK